MTRLSRRDFLKHSTLATAGALLPTASAAPPLLLSYVAGRAFRMTPVHAAPASAEIAALLPADSVTPILASVAGERWFQIPGGYVPSTALQPITPYRAPALETQLGFVAEMVAPVSTLRAWCAATAPVVAKLGYGALLWALDRLVDDRGMVWYGLAAHDAAPLLGWAPALHYARWRMPHLDLAPTLLHLDPQRGQITAYAGARAIQHLPATVSGNVAGVLTAPTAVRALTLLATDATLPLGTPYHMALSDGSAVRGTYAHNRFVREWQESDSMIQNARKVVIELPIEAARWVFAALGTSAVALTSE
jgi:TAT (twin-arginine translocation) pathway signal sequence